MSNSLPAYQNDAYWRDPFTLAHLIYVLRVYEELLAKDAAPGRENAVLYGSAEAALRIETYRDRMRVSGVLANVPGKGRIQLLCEELDNANGLTAANVVRLRARVCRAKRCTLEEADALTVDEAADVLEAVDAKTVKDGPGDALQKHDSHQIQLLLLVHGIRTFAGWQPMVKRILEEIPNTQVVPIRFGFLGALRFWFPLLTRRAAIADLRREIQNARAANPDARLSVIAHSFGTYAISQILLENPDLKIERLILAGSIVPRSYRWDYVRSRLATEVVNDYGTRDVWPVLAKCLSWGYGDTGRHGFGRGATVRDRGHDYSHSEFFNEEFVRTYWKPWFENDGWVPSPWDEKAPPPSWGLSLLSVLPLQWFFFVVLLAVLPLYWFCWRNPSGLQTKTVKEIIDSTIGTVKTGLDTSDLPDLSSWDSWNVRYYVKELPTVQDPNGKQIIADALRSWEAVADMNATEVLREEEATVLLELGPLPFVSVRKDDGTNGLWRIRFSSRDQYDAARLEAAACHAFGRVLGLGYSDDPADVMFDYDSNPTARRARKPSPNDVREIQKRLSR